jgi:hypothetical protein
MTACEFCTAAEVPSYPLTLTLTGGAAWPPLQRKVRICAECVDTLFYPDIESTAPLPISFIHE